MQTFLPYPEPTRSALCLDDRRLGKQRVEALQLIRTLKGETHGWANHPAARMWRGYENALVYYGLTMCSVWIGRDFRDTCYEKIAAYWDLDHPEIEFPPWWGRIDVHLSHQANLVRKDWRHYRQYFPDVDADLPYVWPVP